MTKRQSGLVGYLYQHIMKIMISSELIRHPSNMDLLAGSFKTELVLSYVAVASPGHTHVENDVVVAELW